MLLGGILLGDRLMNLRDSRSICLVALGLSIGACSRTPEKYLTSGDSYLKAGKYNEAILQYRNALELSPKLAKAHLQLARAYLAIQADQQAYKELQQSVD